MSLPPLLPGVWLKRLLLEHDGRAIELCVDNKSAIALMKNPVFHDLSKHIPTRYHFIRNCVDDGDINVQFVRIEDQLLDIYDKGPWARAVPGIAQPHRCCQGERHLNYGEFVS
jgi:hypothetical protein